MTNDFNNQTDILKFTWTNKVVGVWLGVFGSGGIRSSWTWQQHSSLFCFLLLFCTFWHHAQVTMYFGNITVGFSHILAPHSSRSVFWQHHIRTYWHHSQVIMYFSNITLGSFFAHFGTTLKSSCPLATPHSHILAPHSNHRVLWQHHIPTFWHRECNIINLTPPLSMKVPKSHATLPRCQSSQCHTWVFFSFV